MKQKILTSQVESVRERILNPLKTRALDRQDKKAGRVIAHLYRCPDCGAWWGAGEQDVPETQLVFRLVDPHSDQFLWADYRGWIKGGELSVCPACGGDSAVAAITLCFDEEGQVVWPENPSDKTSENPFYDYVSGSERIEENISFIAAREAQRQKNAWGYTAEMDDIREDLNRMREAFKEVVYRYAPILPPGWRVIGDYDKWLKGQACAGFLHGEINPDNSLMIGGQCRTVAEIEMVLDRLHRYVCDLTF